MRKIAICLLASSASFNVSGLSLLSCFTQRVSHSELLYCAGTFLFCCCFFIMTVAFAIVILVNKKISHVERELKRDYLGFNEADLY